MSELLISTFCSELDLLRRMMELKWYFYSKYQLNKKNCKNLCVNYSMIYW